MGARVRAILLSYGLGDLRAIGPVTLPRSVIALALLAGTIERQAAALPPPGRPVRTPWDFYKAYWADKMPDLHRCSALARKRGVFGDVAAHFDGQAKGHVTVDVTKSLGPEIRQCALDELRPYAEKVYGVLGQSTDFEVSWDVGTSRPLLPLDDGFLEAWSEVASASAANGAAAKRFARRLPPDVKLVDGCLVIQPPAKFAFSEAVALWKKRRDAKAIDIFWDGKLAAVPGTRGAHVAVISFPSPHLLLHVERHDVERETDPRTAIYPPRRPTPSTNELCLRPFDGEVAAQVTKAMAAAGQCWRSGPLESLLAPRFSFPAGHTYTHVGSTTRGQACALDVAGEITCCGPTTTTFPGRYQDLDVAANLTCSVSVSGEASCLDADDGRRLLTLAGKFKRVSASTAGACGVDESGAIVCGWTVSRAERPPQGKFREVDAGSLCAIDLAGELTCWSDGRTERVGKGPWHDVTSAKTSPSRACALDAAGRASCWSTVPRGASLAPAPISSSLSKIVMGWSGPCGIDSACGLHCATEKVPFPDQGLCVRDASFGNPSCVVLKRGQVACGGADFWADDPAMTAAKREGGN
jgi:hypothetical protein